MFWHLFKYKVKYLLRAKEEVFWVLLFPLILGTCFYAAFSNISESTENFHTIPVAITFEESSENTEYVKAVFNAMTVAEEGEEALLDITYTDAREAEQLLKKNEITGIIHFKDMLPTLTLLKNDIYASILKEVVDKYVRTTSMMESVVMEEINEVDYITTKPLTDGNTDNVTDYFYSLIAMTCLFGSMLGVSGAKHIKANLSALGMRKELAPIHKLLTITSDFTACYLFLILGDIVLIVYLELILKVNLGGNFGLILLTACVGSLIGLSSGIFTGSIPKLSENVKMAIITAGSLFSSFLSGLMIGNIKYQIEKFAPLVNRINPATVITDALYSLNIYDTYEKFTVCMMTLVAYSILLCTLSYIFTRRETYACL